VRTDYHPFQAVRGAGIAAFLALAIGLPVGAAADPLIPIWTGAYVGVQGGMSRADIDVQQFGTFETTRAAFGGHAGYNITLGGLLVGVEADATYANSSTGFATTGGGSASVDSRWNGSVRGRGGFTLGPILLYATAGWAWTGISTVERAAIGTSVKSSGTFDGVVYGLGAETFILPPLSLRLELLRYDYGTDRLSVAGGFTTLSAIDHGDTVVRAGVTLHFK
jgi:high affinity Mn2+ porin